MLLFLVASMQMLGANPPERTPPPGETAKLYFLAGDLAKAVEWATRGLKTDSKACKPMLKALAEYGFLANHTDEFTSEQARDFIKWDRVISPATPGRLTLPVVERFVTDPLERAKQLSYLDPVQARQFVDRVLNVDPQNAEAIGLKRQLSSAARSH